MSNIPIERHSFNVAKDRLKDFFDKTEAEIEIERVETEGGFLWFSEHKVTANEFNQRLEKIQNHFISINSINNKMIQEFRAVYNALDVLDNDYITSIVANLNAIEKTSNDIRIQQEILEQHNRKLFIQHNKLDEHQIEIENNVENISKIVIALKAFKDKMEGYKHLADIDKMWDDCNNYQKEIFLLSEDIVNLSKQINKSIEDNNIKFIECEKRYEEISYNVENNKEFNKNFEEMLHSYNEEIGKLTKKIKYSYWFIGGALCLAIFEMILFIMRII